MYHPRLEADRTLSLFNRAGAFRKCGGQSRGYTLW